jgi:pilus assembly protein FimV
MFITCQQCSTMFRLDENRLKPQGSKVRCSQCGNLFIAMPPAIEPLASTPAESFGAPPEPPPMSEAAEDRELEGIDLAELDSILEKDRAAGAADNTGLDAEEETVEFNEADLDFDFESALEADEAPVTEDAADKPAPVADDLDDLDLDMDFDLDVDGLDAGGEGTEDTSAAQGVPGDSIGGGTDALTETPDAADFDDLGDGDLTEDVELALDDFEEALSVTDDIEPDIEEADDGGELQADAAGEEAAADELEDDLGLDDLDSFLDDDTPEQEEAELALEDNGELSLSDDFESESAPAAPDSGADAEQEDDLGIGDLDALLEEETLEQEGSSDEASLSLDDDTELSLSDDLAAAAPVDTGTEAPQAESDDLGLDDLGDLDSLLEDDTTEPDEEPEELELSLDDDIDLSIDDADASDGQDQPVVSEDDEFDLSDFDSLLDEADADGEAAGEELDLSLEDDAADELSTAGDDLLDLSDLETEEGEAEPTDDTSDDDIELSLDLEDASETPSEEAAEETDEPLEPLDFELDAEFEDKPLSQTAGLSEKASSEAEIEIEADEEIDLTDIEQMLEDDTIVPETAGRSGGDGEAVDGAERWVDDDSDDLDPDGSDELDLTEIEEAIDAADSEEQEGDALEVSEEELDLDLELEEAPAESEPEEVDLELEMESASTPEAVQEKDPDVLDMSDLDFSLDDDEVPSKTTETIDAGDIELEFEIDEIGASSEPLSGEDTLVASETAAAVTAAFGDAAVEEDISADDTLAAEPVIEKPTKKLAVKKPPKRSGLGKMVFTFLAIILILILLAVGAMVMVPSIGEMGYNILQQYGIQVPYLNDLIKPEAKDPAGVMNLTTLEINSKFIENEKAGRLFIVTGKVRNGYNVPTTMIRLQGKLFTKGKVLAKTAQSYAGIFMTDQELASLEIGDITTRLKSPLAHAKAIQVPPRQAAPFMVVFSDLPTDLDEFAIELISSTKVQ